MIPYETDPTLHDHEPARARLDDGFSPPPSDETTAPETGAPPTEPAGVRPAERAA